MKGITGFSTRGSSGFDWDKLKGSDELTTKTGI